MAKPKEPKEPKPKKRRWYHNFGEAFVFVSKAEKWVPWTIAAIIVGGTVAGVFLGLAWGHPIYLGIITFLFTLIVAMVLLAARVKRVSYRKIDGKPGASMAVLEQIRRGWNIEREPVGVNPRTQDVVFRMVGRPGVVLVTEGPSTRVARLVAEERRKIERVIPKAVPIHIIESGNDQGQVPLLKLQRAVRKLKKQLTAQEVAAVSKRLRSLGTMNLPIPKGIDPLRARPDRKGIQGK